MDLLPGAKVLMLTASTEEDAVIEAVAAGATGFVQNYSGSDDLVNAVREAADGRLLEILRRGWDSNPRSLAGYRISSAAPSSTRPPLPNRRQSYTDDPSASTSHLLDVRPGTR